jgi:hypothetical protein
VNKPKRPKSRARPSRSGDRISHLHVVIDEELQEGLEAHAVKLDPRAKVVGRRLNLSAAARDAMRKGLGLRTAARAA